MGLEIELVNARFLVVRGPRAVRIHKRNIRPHCSRKQNLAPSIGIQLGKVAMTCHGGVASHVVAPALFGRQDSRSKGMGKDTRWLGDRSALEDRLVEGSVAWTGLQKVATEQVDPLDKGCSELSGNPTRTGPFQLGEQSMSPKFESGG
jgi:hypothetical protein